MSHFFQYSSHPFKKASLTKLRVESFYSLFSKIRKYNNNNYMAIPFFPEENFKLRMKRLEQIFLFLRDPE